MRKVVLGSVILASGLALSACTALDLSQLKIADFEGISRCQAPEAAVGPSLFARAAGASTGAIQDDEIPFALPVLSDVGRSTLEAKRAFAAASGGAPRVAGRSVGGTSFQILNDTTARIIDRKVPEALRGDPVVEGIRRSIVKAMAQGQLKRAEALGVRVPPQQAQEVAAAPSGSLSHHELKQFSQKLFNSGLRPTIRPDGVYNLQPVAAPPPGAGSGNALASISNSTIAAYFAAYYEGKFVDRLGQTIAKPQITIDKLPVALTITDAQIAAVETVLIEYIADLIDPTPVMGADALGSINDKSKFYPAGTTARPTAQVVGLAEYRKIPDKGCGITQANAIILADIANAAGDNAALLGGMVSQSFGGITIGLGVLGKISVGDNQTLGNIIKTGASRIGQRVAYAGSYWLMLTLTNDGGEPGRTGAPAVLEMK